MANKKSTERREYLQKLDQQLKQKQAEHEATANQLASMERQFTEISNHRIWHMPHQLKRSLRSTGAYVLGRRNRRELYSKSYRKKKAQNELKKYTYHLYDLGFTEKALADMKQLHEHTSNKYVRIAAAWELGLYYANQYSTEGALCALPYFREVKASDLDGDMRRRLAIMEAECYTQLEEAGVAQVILVEALKDEDHPDLYLALANTTSDVQDKTDWINLALDAYDLCPVSFTDGTYDGLTTRGKTETVSGPKVSVIVPAYNAEQGIQTTLKSLQEQTWRNLEILVVDDSSTDQTREVVQDFMKKDDRIEWLSTPVNSGAYTARNIGLEAATGEYVTVHDADDWSHVEKIAIQAQHLLDHPLVIANTSEHARLTENLDFYRRGQAGAYIFSNMSSLMFRREPVLNKIGYWDPVRFAGDSEFIRRMQKAFGQRQVMNVHTGPLSFPRQSVQSLTGSSTFGYNGFLMGARKEYAEAQRYHQDQMKDWYYPNNPSERAFPAPVPMIQKNAPRPIDLIVVADFRFSNEQTLAEIQAHKEAGYTTGLIQMARYDMTQKPVRTIHESFRKKMNGRDVQMLVYGESLTCDLMLIKDPLLFQYKQHYIPAVEAERIYVAIQNVTRQGDLREAARNIADLFNTSGKWFAPNEQVRQTLEEKFPIDWRAINLSGKNWPSGQSYLPFVKEATIAQHPTCVGGEET